MSTLENVARTTLVRRDDCGAEETDRLGLRIGAIFIILATSLFGTLGTCIIARSRTAHRLIPEIVFDIFKYFGSGVILATGFIHLLEPATDEIGEGNTYSNGGCIPDSWGSYPYPFGLCLASLYLMFVAELMSFRVGNYLVKKYNVRQNSKEPEEPTSFRLMGSGHFHGDECVNDEERAEQTRHQHAADPEASTPQNGDYLDEKLSYTDFTSSQASSYHDSQRDNPVIVQFISVMSLEVGVLLHSIIIGLTLGTASSDEFTTLFIVIIFHQMFEGIGLGTRLGFLELPRKYSWIPYFGSALYSLFTPIGLAGGIGARKRLSTSSAGVSVVSGVLDSISAGVLLYTATVELIAHEFVFNKRYLRAPLWRLFFSLACFAAGIGLMALLGKWA